jgi:hypothetical protein
MKPINSKERNKQFWQFVFIFFGLAFIPVALIFFSYYHVPEEISEMEDRKLVEYSNSQHNQKKVLQMFSEVDSNINIYASAKTENPVLLDKKIADGLSDIEKLDTSDMVNRVRKGYENHYTHVRQLVEAQNKANEAIAKLQDAEAKLKAAQSSGMMGMGAAMPMPPAQ